jgi:hypothetical protein
MQYLKPTSHLSEVAAEEGPIIAVQQSNLSGQPWRCAEVVIVEALEDRSPKSKALNLTLPMSCSSLSMWRRLVLLPLSWPTTMMIYAPRDGGAACRCWAWGRVRWEVENPSPFSPLSHCA